MYGKKVTCFIVFSVFGFLKFDSWAIVCRGVLRCFSFPIARCRTFMQRRCLIDYVIIAALKDYEDALKLNPQNEDLRADAERIRKIIQGTE